MNACIRGLGLWLPDQVRSNDDWPREFCEAAARRAGDRTLVEIPAGQEQDLCARLVAQHLAAEADDPFMGATRRRVADDETTACAAEARAAEAALADAGIAAEDIGMVVSWAGVPDRVAPPSAPSVAHAVGAKNAFAVGMDAACATGITQMAYAAAMIETGQVGYALLTQSHLVTRAFPMVHPASPNIGDAATAIVMGPGPGHELVGTYAVTDGQYYDAVTWIRGVDSDPPWFQGGRAFYLGSKDLEAARFLARNTVRMGVDTICELLRRLDIPVGELGAIISVQPRRWIPGTIAEVLGLPADRAPQTFDELAHLGAAGTVANLLAGREQGILEPGTLAALYAQGSGFTRAAALIRW